MGTVVVVDDAEVPAIGAQVVLERLGVDAVETPWAGLDDRLPKTSEVDLVLAVVRRDVRHWDRYNSLRRMGGLRGLVGPRTRVVAAASAVDLANPLFGLRLEAAGVTEVVAREQLESVDRLLSLVTGSLVGRSPRPSTEALSIGLVGPRSNPSLVIESLMEMARSDPAYLKAFAPGLALNRSGLSRRRAHTVRVKVSQMADLSADPVRSFSGGPVRDRSVPFWSEVVRYVNQARGWTLDDEVIGLFDGFDNRSEPGRPELGVSFLARRRDQLG